MSECLFCGLIERKANMIFEDEKTFVMLSPQPFSPGHVVVMPKKHAPILDAVPDFVVGDLFKIANKVCVAVFEALGAHGTNVLVQNGTAAGQKHNHAMVHVVPRMENDGLQIGWEPKKAGEEDLSTMELRLKEETKSVGIFEAEKQKPIEIEKPKERHAEDIRVKHIKRIP